MKNMLIELIIFILISCLLYIFTFTTTLAHPGNTASDGCHYCRTNCDSWSVAWDERHCHISSNSTISGSKDDTENDNSFLLWAGSIGLSGYIAYSYFKGK